MKKIGLTKNLDKWGVVGLFLTAIATPCCFPLFGFLLSAFGLGSAEVVGGWTEYVFQALALISVIRIFLSYRQHNNVFPVIIGLVGAGLIVYAYNFHFDNILIYAGMFMLLISTGLNYFINRKRRIACSTCTLIYG